MTRRQLTTLVVFLTSLLGTTGHPNVEECDVLVLGAGLAGTSAAWRLVGERPKGYKAKPHVCILEASYRVGGRTKDYTIPGCKSPQTVELGAQWIAQEEADKDVWDLAVNVLNLGVYNGWPWAMYGFDYGPGNTDPDVKTKLDKVPWAKPSVDIQGRTFFGPNVSSSDPKVGLCKDEVARVYASVVLGSPWSTPNAETLDSLTPLEWLKSVKCNITWDDVRTQGLNRTNPQAPPQIPLSPAFYVSETSASSSGQEILQKSSALWWLHNIRSNGGTMFMTVDAQRYRIVGGVQQMSIRLAEKLRKAGAKLELETAVTQVRYSDKGVEFTTNTSRIFRGKYAIITGTPVALSAHISWEPALPQGVERMLKSAHIGNYNKHYAFFNEGPIWRGNRTMLDIITSMNVSWPMSYFAAPPLPKNSQQMPNGTDFFPSAPVDNSPATVDAQDEGCPNGAGALMSFGWPGNGSTAEERAEGWKHLLKEAGLPAPTSVKGQAWSEEPYVMGAYGAWWPPKTLSYAKEQWKAIPGGRVFFAGTEWSDEGAGYMNGAIHNGRKHGSLLLEKLQEDSHFSAYV